MADMYWDTKGVVDIAALENGRIGLKFAGEDGVQRVLTIPASHAAILIVSLTNFAGKIARTHDIGDTISDIQQLIIDSVGVGAAPDGSDYSLVRHKPTHEGSRKSLSARCGQTLRYNASDVKARSQHHEKRVQLGIDDAVCDGFGRDITGGRIHRDIPAELSKVRCRDEIGQPVNNKGAKPPIIGYGAECACFDVVDNGRGELCLSRRVTFGHATQDLACWHSWC